MSFRRPPLPVLAAAALFGVAAVVSAAQLFGEVSAAPLVAASRLDRAQRADVDAVDRTALSAAETAVATGDCDPALTGALSDLIAERLDTVNPATGYDDWLAAMSTAGTFYRHAIACSPSSPVNWARLGALDLIATGDSEAGDRKVEIAGWVSPVFYPDLAQRIFYWRNRPLKDGETYGEPMRRDLRTVLLHARHQDVRRLLRGASTEFRVQVAFEMRALPEQRVAQLAEAGIGGRAAPAGESAPAP